MADIAFLLIIFFMLTTRFLQEAHVRLEQPESPDIAEMPESTPITVSVDEDGAVWLQGQSIPAEAVEADVSALLADRDDKTVMLKVDKHITQEKYGPVIMGLSRANATIALVGTQVRE